MSKKILVIDDSKAVRESVKIVLSNGGYEVIEAANGADALSMMKKHSIGLFISDINMPEMDGITLLRKIKEDNNNKHTPVIMLTTENCNELINESRAAGAKAWMIKPFHPEKLLDAVKTLFVI